MTRKQYVKGLELPKKNKIKISGNLRRMEHKDLPRAFELYNNQNKSSHKIYKNFTEEEFWYMIKPLDQIVDTYVVEGADGVTDFISFIYAH